MNLARFTRIGRQRLRSLFDTERADADLAGELAFHLEQLVQENLAEGMPPEEARRSARRTLGNVPLIEEKCRDQRRVALLSDLRQDLLYGWRMMRRSPGFALIAAGSLALGIGANTAILGMADSLVFGSLPYRDPARLMMIRSYSTDAPAQNLNASLPDFFAIVDGTSAFESIGCSLSDQRNLGASQDSSEPERLTGQTWSQGLAETLGIKPMLGRSFVESDYHEHAPTVVILSYRLWQRRFGGDPAALGTVVRLNGAPAEIAGVMPPDFRFAVEPPDYWVPMRTQRTSLQAGVRYFIVAARLREGVSFAQAEAELDKVSTRLAVEFPDTHTGWKLRLQPVREALYGWTRPALLTLEAAVAVLLLIACANVAGLLLARGAARRQEMAMRAALGAGRSRILRQMMAESLLLSFGGGALGTALAWIALRVLPPLMTPPPNAPRLAAIPINPHVLGLSILISAAAGLIFTLTPALLAWRHDLNAVLTESPRSSGAAAGRQRLRSALVAAQIACAFVLLIASGLALKSFLRLAGRDLNIDPHGVLTLDLRLPLFQYERLTGSYNGFPYMTVDPRAATEFSRVLDRLRELPGVSSAAGISATPVNALVLPPVKVTMEGSATASGDAAYFLVTPNLFSTLRAKVIKGREIQEQDTEGAPWVAIVNETAASRFWPGQDPLGQRFRLDTGGDDRLREVIGVVRDIPVNTRQTSGEPVVYASYLQQPPGSRLPLATSRTQMTFLLRGAGVRDFDNAAAMADAARKAAAEIDPDTPLSNIGSMERVTGAGAGELYYTMLLGGFAALATLLAAIGVYGATSYHLEQRTHEIGIRMALGARPWQVFALVGGRALLLMGIGLAAGAVGAQAVTRYLAALLWQVTPADPEAHAGALVVLALAAALACAAPLRRCLRINPVVALRGQ